MIERKDIIQAVNEELPTGGALFLVDVKVRGDEVEVTIDSDTRVTIDDCAALTKAVEAHFDRETDDFALTVSSAGIGQPLVVARQFRKLVGRQVEVVLLGGRKFTATLDAVETPDGDRGGLEGASMTLSYPEKQRADGEKRPRVVTVTGTFPLTEVKSTCEHIDFK
jgi:ribosome maturation factor RimP